MSDLARYNPFEHRYNLRLHLIFECRSNLSHIGETVGNQANLRETKTIAPDGKISSVFEYSGNAIRSGIFRQCGARSFFDAVGLQVSPKIHQAFFSGGAIDGSTGNDLEFDRKLRQLCPLLSVLGTAKPQNTFGVTKALMIEGRLRVGSGMLVCWENMLNVAALFPAALPLDTESYALSWLDLRDRICDARALGQTETTRELQTALDELIAERQEWLKYRTRTFRQWLVKSAEYPRDSTQQTDVSHYLESGNEPSQKSLFGDTDKKKPKKDEPKDTRNVLQDWLLSKGATIYSRIDGHVTSLEEGVLADALLRFAQQPYLGGKNRTGNGLVDVKIYWECEGQRGQWMQIAAGAQQLSDRAEANCQRYRDYLAEYRAHLESAAESNELKSLLGV